MNTSLRNQPGFSRRSQRGVMLIDCLVYIAMFSLVTGLALAIFYKCTDSSRLVKRTADDITEAVTAGERWRADLRQATSAVRLEDSTDGNLLAIPGLAGTVRYRFSDSTIWRQNADGAVWVPMLSRVKSSRMESNNRPHVTAWRWELELQSRQKYPHTLPLFTFEAVPGSTP